MHNASTRPILTQAEPAAYIGLSILLHSVINAATNAPEEAGHGATPDVLGHNANHRVVGSRLCHDAVEAQHVGVVEVRQQRSLSAEGGKVLAEALTLQQQQQQKAEEDMATHAATTCQQAETAGSAQT